MKKAFVFALLALMVTALLILPFAAEAEAAAPVQEPAMQENVPADGTAQTGLKSPFTWGYLATIAGATAATLLIAQFTKMPLDKVWKIPTRVLVYVIALVLMLLAQIFTGGLSLDDFVLTLVNAFIVALASYGSYELTFAKTDGK